MAGKQGSGPSSGFFSSLRTSYILRIKRKGYDQIPENISIAGVGFAVIALLFQPYMDLQANDKNGLIGERYEEL